MKTVPSCTAEGATTSEHAPINLINTIVFNIVNVLCTLSSQLALERIVKLATFRKLKSGKTQVVVRKKNFFKKFY